MRALVTGPCSSRRSRTASSATREAIPARIAPRASSSEWKARDPIVVLRTQLEAEGVDAGDLDEIESEMSAQLERMRESGLAAPFPTELRAREFKD